MCGIIGYCGKKQAVPILLAGLNSLLYRGYDSSGVCVFDGEKLELRKDVGILKIDESIIGNMGIGHTRWSSHGEVSQINSHPHLSCDKKIAVAHNGIIENYQQLKSELEKRGHTFMSETDTEVIPHYLEGGKDLLESIKGLNSMLVGSYA